MPDDPVVMKSLRRFALLAMLTIPAVAPAQQAPDVRSPADLYGPLFVAVQQQRVFADGKKIGRASCRERV